MKTKRVILYIDLHECWQDFSNTELYATQKPSAYKCATSKRVAIHVTLPCVGGSALTDEEVNATYIEDLAE